MRWPASLNCNPQRPDHFVAALRAASSPPEWPTTLPCIRTIYSPDDSCKTRASTLSARAFHVYSSKKFLYAVFPSRVLKS